MNAFLIATVTAVTLGVTSLEKAPEVFRCAGHSHTCRGTGFAQQLIWDNLKEWSERNSVTAFGLGSPWSPENAKMAVYYEKEFLDRYYAGEVNPDYKFDAAEVQKTIDAANALGTKTIFYVDNETPKQRYGHLWHVGFKVCVPSWHDYDQGLTAWYSPYDDADAARVLDERLEFGGVDRLTGDLADALSVIGLAGAAVEIGDQEVEREEGRNCDCENAPDPLVANQLVELKDDHFILTLLFLVVD